MQQLHISHLQPQDISRLNLFQPMMTLYEEELGPLAKRPRIDYNTNFETFGHPFLIPPQLVDIQLSKKSVEDNPNHILLYTVLNPTFPISCDVLHTISNPFGKVLRIVIFRKNGIQAMLEFDSLESAQRAKESLHGCDIYSGCCTLKIEYAKPTKLNVYKNDSESFDYTNPSLGSNVLEQTMLSLGTQRPVLLKDPLLAAGENLALSPLALALRPHHLFGPPGGQVAVSLGASPSINFSSLFTQSLPRLPSPGELVPQQTQSLVPSQPGALVSSQVLSSPPPNQTQSSVTMVYGLNSQHMNCTRIFNLFCLYGNVVRVKFLKTKEGCAMVQMGDSVAVERAVTNLNNITFFETKMQLGFSKQAFLADVQQPYELQDGSPSFIDFMGNKNNRFINPEMASKNRIQPPSKILHFFNTPPGLDAGDIEKIFCKHGAPKPKCIKMFPSKTERSSSGLIEFDSLSQALESLVLANHVPVENNNGKFPYIMKLCFSSSKAIPVIIH